MWADKKKPAHYLNNPALEVSGTQAKEKPWWKARQTQRDLYYPHNLHGQVMEEEGDSCMLCHPFSATDIIDHATLNKVTDISNEPLKEICHACHVVQLSAPWECQLCHQDVRAIWPSDHNFDYLNHHGETAQLDEGECQTCHVERSFCSDCHFRRDPLQRQVHDLGFSRSHGLEARTNTSSCGSCHDEQYCQDCHQSR